MIEQPPPLAPNQSRSIQGLVRHDLIDREAVGVARYGTPLQAGNGRDALRDAYEEALDLACYLRQAIEERDRPAAEVDRWTRLRRHLVDEHGHDAPVIAALGNSDVVQTHLDAHRLNVNTHTYVAWGEPTP